MNADDFSLQAVDYMFNRCALVAVCRSTGAFGIHTVLPVLPGALTLPAGSCLQCRPTSTQEPPTPCSVALLVSSAATNLLFLLLQDLEPVQ